jgi:hypothetical protein
MGGAGAGPGGGGGGGGGGGDGDGEGRTTVAVVIDPCCGSGTMLHAAWARGYFALGEGAYTRPLLSST